MLFNKDFSCCPFECTQAHSIDLEKDAVGDGGRGGQTYPKVIWVEVGMRIPMLRACFFDELDLYGTNSLKAVSIRTLYTVPFIHVYKFIFVALKYTSGHFW